jgi:CheY-like chemotaxis protein
MSTKKVLSVGQCRADQYSLENLFANHFGAEVRVAHSSKEAVELLRRDGADLVLVNRVFDRDGAVGLDFITRLKSDGSLKNLPVMLVSNFADAQRQAVDRGALPGFGKAALDEPQTLERLGAILQAE